MKKKLVMVCDYFQTQLGYQEYFLAQEWQLLGMNVTVVCADRYYPFPNYESTVCSVLGERQKSPGRFRESGIDVIRLPIWLEYGQGAVILLKGLRAALDQLKPNIIVADGVFSPLAWQVTQYKLNHPDITLIYDSHASSFNTDLSNTIPKKIYMFGYNLLIKPTLLRTVDHYTAVGQSEYRLLQSKLNLQSGQISKIPLGADTSIFKPNRNTRKKMRKKLNLSMNTLLFIYAGKVTPNKDVEVLIQALGKLQEKPIHFSLLILGEGPQEYIEDLRKQIASLKLTKRVIWHNQVPNKDLPDYYNAADIGIWPGDLSNTILEAMATGLAVVLPEKISIDQTSNHLTVNSSALQFQRKNSTSLYQTLLYLVKNKKNRFQRGKNCTKLIQQQFSWHEIAKRHLEVYAMYHEKV